jgi:ribosomal protein S18 acetylase RimI-like enzyme
MPACVRIEIATHADIAGVLASAQALVATDAGRYDSAATNLDWAAQTGLAYVTAHLDSDASLLLVARHLDAVIGHLVGRLYGPSSVHPIRAADLESIHVHPEHRRHGVGRRLLSQFFTWAADRGAQRVSVTAYAANQEAQRFYARHGFSPRSVILDRDVRA